LLKRTSSRRFLFALLVLLVYSVFQSTAIGDVSIPLNDVWGIILAKFPVLGDAFSTYDYPSTWVTIVRSIRLPRVLAGVLVGSSLAMAGAVMQGIFRNSMADPFIIGISSGAAFGASVSLVLELFVAKSVTMYFTPVLAFAGALGAVILVYTISRVDGRVPVETLLLAGVATSSFLSALTSALIYTYSRDVYSVLFWLTGSLGASRWSDVTTLVIAFFFGLLGVLLFAKDLNAMLLGEDVAQSLGTEVENAKRWAILAASVVTATAVAASGIIGFVGLIVPHMARLLVGPDHRVLIPVSTLLGGIFLVWCDVTSRVILPVPVGIITALFGAPFFIYLLKERKRMP